MSFVLRPFQQEALKILGSDQQAAHVICVAPTGAGKSLIYERAAAVQNRRTLLVTPLVALARQQFQKLTALGIPVSLGAGESKKIAPPLKSGAWIISPEMLPDEGLHPVLAQWKPNFLVVDECHCLWDWGDSFRPAFLKIPPLLKQYSLQQSLWLTATLPHPARLALKETLPQPQHELGKFDLPDSLTLNMLQVPWQYRNQALLLWLSTRAEGVLIFVSTRAMTLRLSLLLEHTGKNIQIYHGGLSSEERRNIEKQVKQQIPQVLIATSAFGMGMDYAHLKHVLLWQSPPSILALVQGIGRAGRNQDSFAEATVFWDDPDLQLLEWTLGNSQRRKKELTELGNFFHSTLCRKIWLRNYFNAIGSAASVNSTCKTCDRCRSQSACLPPCL